MTSGALQTRETTWRRGALLEARVRGPLLSLRIAFARLNLLYAKVPEHRRAALFQGREWADLERAIDSALAEFDCDAAFEAIAEWRDRAEAHIAKAAA